MRLLAERPFSASPGLGSQRPRTLTVVVTVDTEPDDAWTNHRCESLSNIRALPRLFDAVREFGVKPTLLITYRVADSADCVRMLERLMARCDVEIGAHLHPWETPPFLPDRRDIVYPAYPHELPLPIFAEKLQRLTDKIESRFGRPTSYRAGRWGITAEHLPVLEWLGYRVDSSVVPLVDWRGTPGIPADVGGRGGMDYRFAPNRPYCPSYMDISEPGESRILEIPISIGFTRAVSDPGRRLYAALPEFVRRGLGAAELMRSVWAAPAWESREHLVQMTRAALAEEVEVLNVAFHSSEFTVGGLPECDSPEKVDEIFRRTVAMLEVVRNSGRCEYHTLSAAAAKVAERRGMDQGEAKGVRRHTGTGGSPLGEISLPPRAAENHGAMTTPAGVPFICPSLTETLPEIGVGFPATAAPKGSESKRKNKLVYILAASHSGSTLLTMLLGTHPAICTVGELKITIHEPDDYPCSCGRVIRHCPFWARVSQAMNRRGFEFDIRRADVDVESIQSRYVRRLLRPLHRGRALELVRDAALALSPTWRRALPWLQARSAALIDSICEVCGKSIVCDSSKYALRLKYLLRNPDIDLQIIRLIRDGRGVALTYYIDEQRLDMRQAAVEWQRSNEEAEEVLRNLDASQYMEVRYEELCAAPRRTLERICWFIGADPAHVRLDFRGCEHHIVGNHMRLQSSSEIQLDDRWRTALAEPDLAIFEEVAGALNRRYGYV